MTELKVPAAEVEIVPPRVHRVLRVRGNSLSMPSHEVSSGRCFKHSEVVAAGVCSGCGSLVCAKCARHLGDGAAACTHCYVRLRRHVVTPAVLAAPERRVWLTLIRIASASLSVFVLIAVGLEVVGHPKAAALHVALVVAGCFAGLVTSLATLGAAGLGIFLRRMGAPLERWAVVLWSVDTVGAFVFAAMVISGLRTLA